MDFSGSLRPQNKEEVHSKIPFTPEINFVGPEKQITV
jgi:hypothetical protein